MKIDIIGVQIDQINFNEAVRRIESFQTDGKKHLITTPYAESIVAAQKDEEFRRIVNGSDLSVPDGGGLLAAAEFLSRPLPRSPVLRLVMGIFLGLNVGLKLAFSPSSFTKLRERVSGTDLVVSLCQISSQKGYKVFFLGGWGGVASESSRIMKEKFPGLQIKFLAGPGDIKGVSGEENRQIVKDVNEFAPDFLFVCLGPLEQEKWLFRQMNTLNAKVFMAVGGAFDMISGKKKRAPKIFQRLNLEWLWRLILEPSRFRRIFNAVLVFPYLVFREKLNYHHDG